MQAILQRANRLRFMVQRWLKLKKMMVKMKINNNPEKMKITNYTTLLRVNEEFRN